MPPTRTSNDSKCKLNHSPQIYIYPSLHHCGSYDLLIINSNTQVWRPIKTVYKHPLAVASATSVPATDFVFRPGRVFQDVNESMLVKYNPKHKWYYKFAQQPDEVLVFKQYDNYGKVRACPHTAFTDEEFEDGEMGRESIEVRVLLFWPGFFEDGE